MKTRVRVIEAGTTALLEEAINEWLEETKPIQGIQINVSCVFEEKFLDQYSRSYATKYIAVIKFVI